MPAASSASNARRRFVMTVTAITLLAASMAASAMAQNAPSPEPGESIAIIVKIRPGFQPAYEAKQWKIKVAKQAGLSVKNHGPTQRELSEVTKDLSDWKVDLVYAGKPDLPADDQIARDLGLDRYYIMTVPAGTDSQAFAQSLRAKGLVIESAQVDGLGGVATIPNDEHFDDLYALFNPDTGIDINATEAWDITTGSSDLVLAVLDAGIDEHADLGGRLVGGWAYDGGSPANVCQSHGTHVAGTAAANGNNMIGTAGVDWSIQVSSYRVLGSCTGQESFVADGITHAVNELNADIINMSLQYYSGTDYLRDSVQHAYQHGVVMIAATGNNQGNVVSWPAKWPETIAVAATDASDQRASFSNYGPEVDIAAPGAAIYSLFGTSGYQYKSGTSMATPHVSGIVGLMLSVNPDLTIEEIRQILCNTAVDVEAPGFDTFTGCGRVDALAAVQAAQDLAGLPGDVDQDGEVGVSDLIAVILAWGPCADCPEDINQDGFVDVEDLVSVVLNWT